MPRIQFAQRALQDLREYDRWRRRQHRGWQPVAILLRQTVTAYLQRFPNYSQLPFRAITIDSRRPVDLESPDTVVSDRIRRPGWGSDLAGGLRCTDCPATQGVRAALRYNNSSASKRIF